jgi:predicted neuraminidase
MLLLLPSLILAADVFREENIFPYQPKHVHSSSIVECPNGDLLVCWFHGSGERTADDVLIQGSRFRKSRQAWSPVFLMADTPDFPDCNPVLFIDRQQKLWLFWVTVLAHKWEYSLLKYRTSTDYAREDAPRWNWQDVMILKPGDDFAHRVKAGFDALNLPEPMWAGFAPPYIEMIESASADPYKRQMGWMTRIRPLQLANGRILLPLYSDGLNFSLVAISDDDGKSWQASHPIVGLGPIQPTLVQKKDNTFVAYMRDSGEPPPRVLKSTSGDGVTWSPSQDTDIPNPDSSLEVVVLQNGHWIMVCNDTEEGRHRLVVKWSADEGKTWPRQRYVANSAAGNESFAYPSVMQSKDGLIHLTFSYAAGQNKTIKHVTINEEWIK